MGADVNAKTKGGTTALLWAASNGYAKMCELLIASGANVNAKNKYGDTVLMKAAEGGSAELVKLLIEKGADVKAKDEYDNTVLMKAAEGGSAEAAKLLIEKGVAIEAREKRMERTALMLAVKEGSLEVAELLVANGADIKARDKYDKTALLIVGEEALHRKNKKKKEKNKEALIALLKKHGTLSDESKYEYLSWKGKPAARSYADIKQFKDMADNKVAQQKMIDSGKIFLWSETTEIELIRNIGAYYEVRPVKGTSTFWILGSDTMRRFRS